MVSHLIWDEGNASSNLAARTVQHSSDRRKRTSNRVNNPAAMNARWFASNALVAPTVERPSCKRNVMGSNPIDGTNLRNKARNSSFSMR